MYLKSLEGRASRSHLAIYDLTTRQTKEVRCFEHVIEAPNWTRDGKGLIYNAKGKLFRLELESGIERELLTGEADTCNNDHVLSPIDYRIAVSSGKNGDLLSKIYVVDPENGVSRLAVPQVHSYLHGWSPDGRMLAYCGARMYNGKQEWDVYTVPASGGEEHRLTTASGLNDGPEYAPDGKTIWFCSERTGHMQIWRMRTDGSEQTQMTFDEQMNAWFPHISPNGEKVVYLAYHAEDLKSGEHLPDKNVELRMISAQGGIEQTLLSFFGGQGSINVNSWAPNSSQFAFVHYENRRE